MLDLMSPETRANPYPLYAELRRTGVRQVEPGGLWAVSRYEDVVAVLKDSRRFSSEGLARGFVPPWLERNPVAQSLVVQDPPVHGRLRGRVARAFGPAALSEDLTQGLLRQEGTPDFVEHFSLRLPVRVLGMLFGLEADRYPQLKGWADDLVSIPAGRHPPEEQARIRQSLMDMERCFESLIQARREAPGSDLISDLIRPGEDGSVLTHEELVSFLFSLLPAGVETTVYLLSNTMLVLSEHPEVLARVQADPRLIPKLIEEVLRFEPPGHSSLRLTTEETEVGGVRLPRGAPVVVLMAAALRDERQFPQADRFLLERGGQSHLAFGHGIHYCLGAMLARLEARLGLEALLPRLRGFSRVPGPIAWSPSLIARGPLSLPLRLLPA
jgi:hypothetical protein